MDNKRIILIGGAPTTGKSTVAHKLARHFDLPWINRSDVKDQRKVETARNIQSSSSPKGTAWSDSSPNFQLKNYFKCSLKRRKPFGRLRKRSSKRIGCGLGVFLLKASTFCRILWRGTSETMRE